MQNSTLVVTGGLGFIGKNFLEYIKNHYETILVIDKNSSHSDIDFFNAIKQENMTLIESDIGDVDNFKDLMPRKFDLVFVRLMI